MKKKWNDLGLQIVIPLGSLIIFLVFALAVPLHHESTRTAREIIALVGLSGGIALFLWFGYSHKHERHVPSGVQIEDVDGWVRKVQYPESPTAAPGVRPAGQHEPDTTEQQESDVTTIDWWDGRIVVHDNLDFMRSTMNGGF